MKTLIALTALLSSVSFAQKKTNTSTTGGRFQLIQLSDFRRDQYLLDTQTGRLWSNVCSVSKGEDCQYYVWTEQDVVGLNISVKDYLNKSDKIEKFSKESESK